MAIQAWAGIGRHGHHDASGTARAAAQGRLAQGMEVDQGMEVVGVFCARQAVVL